MCMKRVFLFAAFFMLLLLFGFRNKGQVALFSDGMQHGFNIIKQLERRADSVYRSEKDKKKACDEKYAKYITARISEMSLNEKLSQMMILTNPKDITEQTIASYQPGGIIYFSVDFKDKTIKEVAEKTKRLQAEAKCPMFIGVDEEGGKVSRIFGLRENRLPEFQSARVLWKDRNIEIVRADTREKNKVLKQMGINLNFNPVADVSNQRSAYMYERCAGGDGKTVADYVEVVLEVMQKENMCSCIKHFPGYGNNANTHAVYTVDKRPLTDYEASDFLPFKAGIKKGADMVMVSHIVMQSVDDTSPASLSKEVHRLLREELGYEGVVITDDLNMRAILLRMTIEQASKAAIIAGNDMIFSADYAASLKGMKQAVEDGKISEKQIDEALTRILKMKLTRGIIVVE